MQFICNFTQGVMGFVQKKFSRLWFAKGYLFLLPVLFSVNSLMAQSGSINGIVTDKNNNEALIGANVLVIGTTTGASTDIDGHYEIKGLKAGKYQLRFSYISYQNLVVDNVIVKPNEAAVINAPLAPAATQLEEVVITAEALKNSEASILKIQKNSENIVDGVSAELISKNNSTSGTDVLKRMTGVTISDGKYAYIRGVGDRYNNTLLNGANLPSTDPEKKSFSYDIFPASLIENVITSKTFTPDKPADFSGGLVEINTVEFPSSFIFDVSMSGTYNTLTTGKNFLTYNGGSRDFLGFDDGTREMPSTINSEKVSRGTYTDAEIAAITGSFKNDWEPHLISAPINGSLKLNIGNKYDLSGSTFGFIGSINYSNSGTTKNIDKSFYDFSGARYLYNGNSYTRSVDLGAMLNFSYKFGGTNKISFKNIYNNSADDITTFYAGDYRYADQYREITSLDFVSRSLLSNQLIGEHIFNLLNGLNAAWNISYSRSKRDEPDARRFVYQRAIDEPNNPLTFMLTPSIDTRYYGNLTDDIIGGSADFTIKLFEDPYLPKLKTGFALSKKDREFDARSFGFGFARGANDRDLLLMPVDSIFQSDNISKIQVQENTHRSDSYTSKQQVNAGYLMFDATFLEQFRLVLGARLENSVQEMNTFDLRDQSVNIKDTYNDVLPGINLTYLVSPSVNVRAAYSITLARPEFREMAPFSYFDFIANELVQGNPDLKRTLIRNYDLRFELYPGAGELVALSFFYKNFLNPIEQTLKASANEPIRSFINADKADNYGFEIELRKNLAFISSMFQDFSFIGNASFINSKVKISNLDYQQSERALQGQAPYIFNLGLYYDNYNAGINTSITYNKVGERIEKVGTVQLGNILEKPVDLIDLSVSKTLFEYLTLKLTVKDLLNQDKLLIQQAPAPYGDIVTQREITGRNISVGIKYKL